MLLTTVSELLNGICAATAICKDQKDMEKNGWKAIEGEKY